MCDWAFYEILSVPCLNFEQFFTVLFNEIECYSKQKCPDKIRIGFQVVMDFADRQIKGLGRHCQLNSRTISIYLQV